MHRITNLASLRIAAWGFEFCSRQSGSYVAALSLDGNTLPWRFLISAQVRWFPQGGLRTSDPRGRDKLRVLSRGHVVLALSAAVIRVV